MKALNSQQRSWLTSRAHSLNPVVMIGNQGLTAAVHSAIEEALTAHQLIKIRFQGHKESRKEITEEICKQNQAHLVKIIGNIAIVYRPPKAGEKVLFDLPN